MRVCLRSRLPRSPHRVAASNGAASLTATHWLQRAALASWQRRGLWAWATLPVTAMYATLVAFRRWAYRSGWRSRWVSPVPMLVVGNVVVGGTGKTPLLIALTRALQSRGLRVGLVSRGYGRTGTECVPVTSDSTADEVGDEPLLVHHRTAAPMWVAAQRKLAVQALLKAHGDLDIVLCDDGLQHWAIAPQMALCAFDERGIGNGWLLPSGPLRETWPPATLPTPGAPGVRLASIAPLGVSPPAVPPAPSANTPHFSYTRAMANEAIRADGTRHALRTLQGNARPLVALAGIGQPDVFFDGVKAAGVKLSQTVPLADHFQFDSKLLNTLEGSDLICTEKDAVKLWRHRPDAWAVPLTVTLPDTLIDWVLAALPPAQQRQSTATTTATNSPWTAN